MSGSLEAPPPRTPAGWYESPAGDGQLRYWDGEAWTDHYAPPPSWTPPPPEVPTNQLPYPVPVAQKISAAVDEKNRRRWRRRHSAWLLAPILGLGYVSFVGFVYCAIRVRTRAWVILAVASVLLTIAGYIWVGATTDSTGAVTANAGLYMVELWIASIVFALLINRDYLEWRAHRPK